MDMGAVPVPDKATVCGLPLELSPMLSVAARLPVAAGAKFTVMMVFPPGVTVMGAGPALTLKSAAFAPEVAIDEMIRLPVPVFVTVTPSGVLVPTS